MGLVKPVSKTVDPQNHGRCRLIAKVRPTPTGQLSLGHGVSHENEWRYVNQTTLNGMEQLTRTNASQTLPMTYGQGESQEWRSAQNSVRAGADGTNARRRNERLRIHGRHHVDRASVFLF